MAKLERGGPGSRPTLVEVGDLAGVSRATVSRVINNSPRVSDEVRASVERAIAKLGYVPNQAARSLVTRRADAVALVVCEPEARFFSDPFFAARSPAGSAALRPRVDKKPGADGHVGRRGARTSRLRYLVGRST